MPPELLHLLLTAQSLILWLFLLTIIFVPLEMALAVNRQPALRKGLPADIAFFFMTGFLPTLVLALPLGVIAAAAREILPGSYYLWVTGLPIWLQIIAAIVIGEFGFYWGHRFMHEVPWLWRFHAIHHDPERMDWLINTRAHPVDLIITRMSGLALVNIAGFGTPGAGSGSLIPIVVLIVGTLWGFLIHANLRVRFGWFEHVLSSPRFHHWHHSRVDHPNHNYASMLPIYDRLFGTLHLPKGAWPPSYGIAPDNRPDVLIAARHEPAPTDAPRADAKDAA